MKLYLVKINDYEYDTDEPVVVGIFDSKVHADEAVEQYRKRRMIALGIITDDLANGYIHIRELELNAHTNAW